VGALRTYDGFTVGTGVSVLHNQGGKAVGMVVSEATISPTGLFKREADAAPRTATLPAWWAPMSSFAPHQTFGAATASPEGEGLKSGG